MTYLNYRVQNDYWEIIELFSTETRVYLLICNLIAPIVKWMQGADETEVKITQNNAKMS